MKTSDVSIHGAIMSDFTTGKQPLLPEGYYNGRIVVYEVDHQAEQPRVLSDPSNGVTSFWICYNAKAPQITSPNAVDESVSLLGTDFTKASTTPTVGGQPSDEVPQKTRAITPPVSQPTRGHSGTTCR